METGVLNMKENINKTWKRVAEGIKEIVSESRGSMPDDKQIWLQVEEVLEIISKKNLGTV